MYALTVPLFPSFSEAPRRLHVSGDAGGPRGWVQLKEGEKGRVRCEVEGGRPPPSAYEWWLECPESGRDAVSNASSDSELVLDKVARDWHNCSLECGASHPALTSPLRSKAILNVTCKCYQLLSVFFLYLSASFFVIRLKEISKIVKNSPYFASSNKIKNGRK
jgi:hypothetical protein